MYESIESGSEARTADLTCCSQLGPREMRAQAGFDLLPPDRSTRNESLGRPRRLNRSNLQECVVLERVVGQLLFSLA